MSDKKYFSTMNTGEDDLISTTLFSSGLQEPAENFEASKFIAENYDELCKAAMKMGVDPSKAQDCVHDVFQSIVCAENFGEGYDMNRGNRDSIISVRQFVFGRLKGYSQNVAYRKPTEASIMKPDGKGYFINEIPASNNSDSLEDMTACQMAYNAAPAYDNLSDVESKEAFEEELDYVLSFDSLMEGRLGALLLNIEYFKNNADSIDIAGLFAKMRELPAEFRETFANVVKFSSVNAQQYQFYVSRALAAKC